MQLHDKFPHLCGTIGMISLLGLWVFLNGCGGSDGSKPKPGLTMLMLGATSAPELSTLQRTYSTVPGKVEGEDPRPHKMLAIGCNSFTPEALVNHPTLRTAFASRMPVTFFDMTEAHKKALMLPRLGVATAGKSTAVMVIPGIYGNLREPGVIIESKPLTTQTRLITDKNPGKTISGKAEDVPTPQVGNDPQCFATQVNEAVEHRYSGHTLNDDPNNPANPGTYLPPTGTNYFGVLLVSGGCPTIKVKDTQQMYFKVSWYIYVFDDVNTDKTFRDRKILITTVGESDANSKANTGGHWAVDSNPFGEDAKIGFWLGAVRQQVNPFVQHGYVDQDDLLTSSPNSTEKTTEYTTSVGASVGSDGVGSFTIGASTTTPIQDWVVQQKATPLVTANAPIRNGVEHVWMQNHPFNSVYPTNGDNVMSRWFDGDNEHMPDLPAQSNGKTFLYTKSSAIFQTPVFSEPNFPNASLAILEPIFTASLYLYYETGGDYTPHLLQQDFTYSPGVLQIEATDVASAYRVEYITFDTAPSGTWVVPFGQTVAGTITVSLNKQAANDVTVLLYHQTDQAPSNQIGLSWQSGGGFADAKPIAVTIKANSSAITIPVYATSGDSTSNPGKIPFAVTVIAGFPDNFAVPETLSTITIKPF